MRECGLDCLVCAIFARCGGAAESRNYFTDLAENVPETSVILTLGALSASERIENTSRGFEDFYLKAKVGM